MMPYGLLFKLCGLPAARWQNRGWKKPHKWVDVAMRLVGDEGRGRLLKFPWWGAVLCVICCCSGVGCWDAQEWKWKGVRSGGPGMRWGVVE